MSLVEQEIWTRPLEAVRDHVRFTLLRSGLICSSGVLELDSYQIISDTDSKYTQIQIYDFQHEQPLLLEYRTICKPAGSLDIHNDDGYVAPSDMLWQDAFSERNILQGLLGVLTTVDSFVRTT